jgi:hypothetical protein
MSPCATVNNKVYWWNTGKGEGGESCEEQSEHIKRNRSLSGYGELVKDSSKRYDVGRKVGDGREFLLQRQTQGVYLCNPSLPRGEQASH